MSDTSHVRIDGVDRVTGKAKYTSDLELPGMLFGRVVMSLHPHATVKVDTSQAEKLEGVVAVVTARDGLIKWSAGDVVNNRFAITDRPRFIGDVVAAVAAVDRSTAEKGAELVSIDYEDLPSVFSPSDALSQGAPKLWPRGNTQNIVKTIRGEDFKESDHNISCTYRTSRTHPVAIETIAVLASWDGDRLALNTESQGVSNCRIDISNDLNIPLEKVRVSCRYKGGGFGNKNCAMNYDLIATLLSKKSRRPVLLEYSRSEDFLGHHTRWSTEQRYKLGVRNSGIINSLKVTALCDIGAYGRHPGGGYIEGPDRLYPIPNFELSVQPVYTNNPPTGNVRAPTELPSFFALESAIDEAAYSLQMDPMKFRLLNLRRPALYRTTSNGLEECIRQGAELFRWTENWRPSSEDKRLGGKRRGFGMAIGDYESYVGKGEAEIRLNQNGRVDLAVGVTDIGTGAKTTMAILAAEALGIDIENVNVVWGDTGLCPFSIGESGSRTTSLTGHAVTTAATGLIGKLTEKAALMLKLKPSAVRYESGYFFANKNPQKRVSLLELASKIGSDVVYRAGTDLKLPEGVRRYSYAAAFAEVEVDTETGQISVVRYVASHDSGKIVNRLTAESQIRGGIVMGLSACLSEQYKIDQYGNTLTTDLSTYHIQRHNGVPSMEVIFVETIDPYGPKTLGETSVLAVSPAIGNAVFNAVGVRLYELPFLPDRVYAALHAKDE